MPSVFGETFVTLLKMLINTRKRVTSRAILPGTTWVIDTDMREVVMVVMVSVVVLGCITVFIKEEHV